MALSKVLKIKNDADLLSFIINQTPELSADIDLPVQGEGIQKYGKIIVNNERYKNAFLNTINLIGLTIIDRNYWENPWESFANRGSISLGQTVRELLVDIADVFDYQKYQNDGTHFLENVVPNVYNYLHELNYEKFYKTTTSDTQIAMAFNTENGLMDLIEKTVGSLYEGYKYDKYIVDKYQLCRRILDGTVTSIEIKNWSNLTARQRVSAMKSISNKLTFRSPNYNPAGARVATNFANQIMIMNTDFEAEMTTEVLATSFFRNDAEMKSRLALIDGFDSYDEARLVELLGDGFEPFTEDEKTALAKIPAVIIDDEWFQDYNYSLDNASDTKMTNFYNPETLKNNHWLHTKKVISTSPFKNAVVFTTDVPAVTSVTVAPQQSSISAGQNLQLGAVVKTTGFANKAVVWSVAQSTGDKTTKVTVDMNGLVKIPKDYDISKDAPQIKIRATSVYDNTKYGEASITVL
jgi:hypothetical protein|nr:MAG TPA: Head protein [Caudoviricetes sp.]